MESELGAFNSDAWAGYELRIDHECLVHDRDLDRSKGELIGEVLNQTGRVLHDPATNVSYPRFAYAQTLCAARIFCPAFTRAHAG
jgi:hypothetical protein